MTGPAAPRSGWLTVLLLCGCAVFSALLELLFIPLYVGSVLVPVTVVAALASNILLPRWGYAAVGRLSGAVLPVLCWLVPLLALTVYQRPEGDVLVLAGQGQQWAFYGVLLVGAVAGFATVIVSERPMPRTPPTAPVSTTRRPAPGKPGKRPPLSR
jgi:hypothetical protein